MWRHSRPCYVFHHSATTSTPSTPRRRRQPPAIPTPTALAPITSDRRHKQCHSFGKKRLPVFFFFAACPSSPDFGIGRRSAGVMGEKFWVGVGGDANDPTVGSRIAVSGVRWGQARRDGPFGCHFDTGGPGAGFMVRVVVSHSRPLLGAMLFVSVTPNSCNQS